MSPAMDLKGKEYSNCDVIYATLPAGLHCVEQLSFVWALAAANFIYIGVHFGVCQYSAATVSYL